MKNTPIQNKKMYLFLALSMVAVAIGFQGWTILINNFAVNVVHVNGFQMGAIQSLREVPGLLSFLAIYLLLMMTEKRIVALGMLVMGLGICLVGYFPTYYGIIFTTLIMSFGFHYSQAMSSSLSIQAFDKKEAPVVLGKLNSVAAISSILVSIAIFGLTFVMGYKSMFILLGFIPIIFGFGLLFFAPKTKEMSKQKKKIVLKKKYWLFYLLTFLDGARRQIFIAFAIFLLVDKFHYSLAAVTILFIFNNLVNYFVGNRIGKLVNVFGERKVLTLSYAFLIVVFLIYAFTSSGLIAGLMYIIDNIFFNASVGISTFFQKIATKEDIAASTTVGFTINHIAAVVLPLVGGLLWLFHYRWVFIGAAIIAVISLVATQYINREIKKNITA